MSHDQPDIPFDKRHLACAVVRAELVALLVARNCGPHIRSAVADMAGDQPSNAHPVFGAYALADGVFALAAAIFGRGAAKVRWWLVLVGLLGIAIGIGTFVWPGLTALTLLYFIAGWVVATGVLQIIGAIELRNVIEDEWWLILDGALAVLFGIFLFILPGAGALALIWLIALFAIAYGILMIGFAFKVRKFKEA